MSIELIQTHNNDRDGNPAGGMTTGVGIRIEWQNGPLGRGPDRKAPNGAFVEGVILAAIGRLEYYQRGKFRNELNDCAIEKLRAALELLEARTRHREDRGVEGTHAP